MAKRKLLNFFPARAARARETRPKICRHLPTLFMSKCCFDVPRTQKAKHQFSPLFAMIFNDNAEILKNA
jgi:hypothetical protein